MKPFCLIMLVALITTPLAAQNTSMMITRLDVPFDFVVNETTLPAGNYAVWSDFDNQVLTISNTATGAQVFALINSFEVQPATGESKLVFRRDGYTHVLHQVQRAGDTHTHDLVHRADVIELAGNRM
jgi:hypothetical protein